MIELNIKVSEVRTCFKNSVEPLGKILEIMRLNALMARNQHTKRGLFFQEHFGHGSTRIRQIGIVALARKLLIKLWRYLETGVIPKGAG